MCVSVGFFFMGFGAEGFFVFLGFWWVRCGMFVVSADLAVLHFLVLVYAVGLVFVQ